MNRMTSGAGLVVLVSLATILAQAPAHKKAQAKAWRPEQQEVLDVFSEFFKAVLRGEFAEIKSYWHPNIVGWDIDRDSPMLHDDFLKAEEGFFEEAKFTKLEFEPLAVQVEGNTAVIHLKYDDVIVDRAGKETSASGHWTTTLVRQDKKWVILSNVWKEK